MGHWVAQIEEDGEKGICHPQWPRGDREVCLLSKSNDDTVDKMWVFEIFYAR